MLIMFLLLQILMDALLINSDECVVPCYYNIRSALDKDTDTKVAIKKVTRAFEDPVDAKRILREIKLMKRFKHENVSYK